MGDETEMRVDTVDIAGDPTTVVHVNTTDAFGVSVQFELTLDDAAELGRLLQAVAK